MYRIRLSSTAPASASAISPRTGADTGAAAAALAAVDDAVAALRAAFGLDDPGLLRVGLVGQVGVDVGDGVPGRVERPHRTRLRGAFLLLRQPQLVEGRDRGVAGDLREGLQQGLRLVGVDLGHVAAVAFRDLRFGDAGDRGSVDRGRRGGRPGHR
jgi:hypothetical protein